MMRRLIDVALLVVLLASSISQALGQSILLPNRPNATANLTRTMDPEQDCFYLGNSQSMKERLGLEGIVYRDAIEGAGYNRWRVVMRRVDGKPFDRNQPLRLVLETSESPSSPSNVHEFELVQGEIESHTSFLAPNYLYLDNQFGNSNGGVKVYADGRELTGLTSQNYFDHDQQKRLPTRTVSVASRERLLELLDDDLSSDSRRDLRRESVWYLPAMAVAVDKGLPSDWRELSNAPYIVIELQSFVALSDAQKKGLAEYVVCGSDLIITDCNGLAEVPSELAPWLKSITGKSDLSLPFLVPWKNGVIPYAIECGFGRITLIEGSLQSFKNAEERRAQPFERASRINRLFDVDKMNWTIPKIGRPPVWMFLFSIATFTVVAGPGMLWWINQKLRRPVWLLVVFPALAAALTLGIFAFAIFHDGFGTHARIRSVTICDATSGVGSVYARQTFFSGFPAGEATFAANSEAWEILSSHEMTGFQAWNHKPTAKLSLQPSGLHYQGILKPRDQRQWVTLRPLEGFHPFDWLEDPDGPQVRNRLNEGWKFGVFTDDKGNHWSIERAEPNKTHRLESITRAKAAIELTFLLPKEAFPEGYSDTPNQSLFDWMDFNRYRYWNTNNTQTLGAAEQPSRFESRPSDWIISKLKLPRNFLLVLERGDHVDRPLGDCREEDSSHIVIGTW